MHRLVRQVRFSINPFLPTDNEGANSYSSRPSGEGLGIFFELGVGLIGEAAGDTGLVVNVADIDKVVRRHVVPVFAGRIREYFRQGKHIGFFEIAEFLKITKEQLAGKFDKSTLGELSLKLNPYRKVAIDCEDMKMIYFSEKFEFAAMHKLWNDDFTKQHNIEIFGKCANPAGHGHNYAVEVAIKMPAGQEFCIGDFEKIVDDRFIKLVDHKNLNADVPYFASLRVSRRKSRRQAKAIPTVENLAVLAWEKLVNNFKDVKLHCVTVWETDKTCCSYYG